LFFRAFPRCGHCPDAEPLLVNREHAAFAPRPAQRYALNELKAESLLNVARQEMAGSTVKA
jgi:hypothetical protein